jgi:hypothetical protein
MLIVNIIRKNIQEYHKMLPLLIFLFMMIPAYADWPSDCNELGIGEILGIDCNAEKEPRTIFFFNGTSPSDWINECNNLRIERITKIWQNEISPKDSITCLYVLEYNLTERQLGIIGKETQWGKMIPLIEDKFMQSISAQLRPCVELRPDLAVLEGSANGSAKNTHISSLPHWGFGLMLNQSCTTTGKASEIRGYFDFVQEKITFDTNEVSKMKTVLPVAYFEEILNLSNSVEVKSDVLHPQLGMVSPLKQSQSGTKAQDVVCGDGLQLIFKPSNGNPACVKESNVSKFILRGWAKPV